MPKRGENIYKRKDGRWEGRILKGYDSGRRLYHSVYGKSYRDVKEKMMQIYQKEKSGSQNRKTLEEASRLWMQSQSTYWKASTCAAYEQMLNKYIVPYIGNMPIDHITNQVLSEFITEINGQEEVILSRNYLFQICAMVRRIMIYTNRQGDGSITIPVNPVKKGQFHAMMLPDESSLAVLENYLYDHRAQDTCVGILIALHTGIRVGELSALMWKDIDLEEGCLYIRRNMIRIHDGDEDKSAGNATKIVSQKPKSADSERVIPLPPYLSMILRECKKEASLYVISGVKAAWAEPRTIQYRFKSILKKCGIEYFNIHTLRHTFATRCVTRGLDVKSLSEILGHSSVQLTLNLYVHPTMQQKQMMMEQYDKAIH